MKRYPAYKHSGVEWFDEVPAHWETRKLKWLANISLSNIDKKSNDGEPAAKLCNYVDVYYNENITSNIEFMEATTSQDKIDELSLEKGDILITKDSESPDDIAVPAFVPASLPGVVCGYHLALVRPCQEYADGNYLFRSFSANGIRDQFEVFANGVTRFGIGKYTIENAVFLAPSLEEQRAIADYLDRKTAAIDTLIAKKERQIQLLQEQRAAVINQVVTQGLNPDAPMKDSGIEWLGEIPTHWEVIKTKYLFRLSTEKAPEDNDFELLSLYTDIGVRPRKDLEAKGNKATTTDGYWMVKKGDIIVNKLLAWMGAVGVSEYDGVTSPAYDILRHAAPIDSKYYHYLFRCGVYLPEFRRRSRGIMDMRLRLYFDELGQIPVPYPPVAEQKEIVAKLEDRIAKVDLFINKTQTLIAELLEYRTAIISAAVTGKIDVRNEIQKANIT